MTSEELRRCLGILALNQSTAARLLGLDRKTFNRYAVGLRSIPYPVAMLLRAMVRLEMTPDYARELTDEPVGEG